MDELRRFVHSPLAYETPTAPVSPGDFRDVLLTGATGFVGRFFLRALLRQSETLVVHCLVRAGGIEHGFQRMRDALKYAEIWEEDWAPRLHVVPGDVAEDRFGLSEADFDDLCQRIDAVYHLAADVGLVLLYAELHTR